VSINNMATHFAHAWT